METIVAAAIETDDLVCFVKKPGRHHNVIRCMAGAGIPIPITGTQGFVTSTGRFVGREEARKIAEAADQVIRSTVDDAGVPCKFDHPHLFGSYHFDCTC